MYNRLFFILQNRVLVILARMVGHVPLFLAFSSHVSVSLDGQGLHVHNKVCMNCGCVSVLSYLIPLYFIAEFL